MGKDLSRVFDQVLMAAVNGPFFPEWEFSILFGRSKEEVRAAIGGLSPGAEMSREQRYLLRSALNNLLGYPHDREDAWSDWLSMTPAELGHLLATMESSGHEA
jgi:hypothetical protein